MIDLSKSDFQTFEDRAMPGIEQCSMRHALTVSINIDRRRRSPSAEFIRQHLQEAIWHKTYGDLRGPLAEFFDLALVSARDASSAIKLSEAYEKIAQLLKFP